MEIIQAIQQLHPAAQVFSVIGATFIFIVGICALAFIMSLLS